MAELSQITMVEQESNPHDYFLDKNISFEKRLNIIRLAYDYHRDKIMSSYRQGIGNSYNPSFLDWQIIYSPIEELAWDCVLRHRYIGLFPQYPVLNYFIDFANPVLKIAVEIDGKTYHDEKKDFFRDEKLARIGWITFRIPSDELFVLEKECEIDIEQPMPPSFEEFCLSLGSVVVKSCSATDDDFGKKYCFLLYRLSDGCKYVLGSNCLKNKFPFIGK